MTEPIRNPDRSLMLRFMLEHLTRLYWLMRKANAGTFDESASINQYASKRDMFAAGLKPEEAAVLTAYCAMLESDQSEAFLQAAAKIAPDALPVYSVLEWVEPGDIFPAQDLSHIVLGKGEGNNGIYKCLVCGDELPPMIPEDIETFLTEARAFMAIHAFCYKIDRAEAYQIYFRAPSDIAIDSPPRLSKFVGFKIAGLHVWGYKERRSALQHIVNLEDSYRNYEITIRKITVTAHVLQNSDELITYEQAETEFFAKLKQEKEQNGED